MDLQQIRGAFPHTEELIYMNHAAVSPVSKPVLDAVHAFLQERHLTNIENYFDFMPVVDEAKQLAAKLLGTHHDQIAFVSNTSYGLNILAHGLAWRKGDRILIPGCEFPANVYPFMKLAEQGVEVDFVNHHEGTFSIDDIEGAITPDTRLLSISWVQFLSGFKADLKAIGDLCNAHDMLFCVDAIQGLGALEIDVEACGIDFLASGGHKWLMAMQGIGLIYVAKPLLEQLRPFAGWLHGPIDWEHLIDYKLSFFDDARRFDLGTQNAVGIAALRAALSLHLEATPAWCEQQVLANASRLRSGLKALGCEIYGESSAGNGSGIVAIKHNEADTLFESLKARRIHVAVRNGLLRIAPTYYNSGNEIDAVIEALKKLLQKYPV